MPKEPSEESGERAAGEARAMAPLRLELANGPGAIRRRLELAALEASGEAGYRQLTVQRILDRAEVSRTSFYRAFTGKAECYAAGYAVAMEQLEAEILRECSKAERWLGGLRASLEILTEFVESEPHLAKGLLAEVHVAGGAAMAKRKEVFERLSRAIDTARRENESRHSPPPIAASFILNAIEAMVVKTLAQGRPEAFAPIVPELVHIAAAVYFGDEGTAADGGARR
jgi:AcrR family transcriptional regulator